VSPERPYSPWRRAGDFIIVSGQLGLVYGGPTAKFAEGGAPGQLRQALTNASSVLGEASATMADVVKATLFLLDMNDFAALNEVWLEVFKDPLPTRSAVAVKELPLNAQVEVEFWAYSPAH
jgi:2-iminobutanoate/2-iminopropanoate deaminase